MRLEFTESMRRLVSALRRDGGDAAPAPVDLPQTGLSLWDQGDGVQVVCETVGPVFRMAGRLLGLPVRVATAGNPASRLRYRFQVLAESRPAISVVVVVSQAGTVPLADPRIVRTTQGSEEDGRQVLEVVLTDASRCELRYLFECGSGAVITGFPKVRDDRPLFATIPPVPLMSALIRAAAVRSRQDPPEILTLLRSLLEASRSPVAGDLADWLEDLPEAGPSASAAAVSLHEWLGTRPDPPPLSTLTACLVFIDLTNGTLPGRSFREAWLSGSFPEPSIYAVAAAASAFDGDAVLLRWDAGEEALSALADLAFGPLLVGRRHPGAAARSWRVGCSPDGGVPEAVLLRLPLLEGLAESDLDVLLELERPLMAHFTSDLDHSVLWSRVDPHRDASSNLAGRFSFPDGPSVYHFSGRVVGRLVESEAVRPTAGPNLVAAYRDNRGNLHYRCFPGQTDSADLAAAVTSELEWTGQVVEIPDLCHLPGRLDEPDRNQLLGRFPALHSEIRRLQDLREALAELALPPVYESVRPDESVAVARVISPFLSGGRLRNVEWCRDLAGLAGERREAILQSLARVWALQRSGASVGAGLRSVQALLAGHCLALLEGPTIEDRLAGLALASAAEFSISKSTADPLQRAVDQRLQDSGPAVVRAALAVVVRRALEVPVPVLRVTLENPTAARPGPNRVDSRPGALKGLQVWLDDLRRCGPWPQALDTLAPSGRVDREVAESLLGFVEAVNAEFETRGLKDQVRFLCLIPDSRLDAARDPLLASWQLFSLDAGASASEQIRRQGGAAVYRRYLHFAQWSGAETLAEHGVSPMLGGPLHPLTVHRLEAGESLAPRAPRTREASPLFLELVEASGGGAVGRAVRLCLLSQAAGFPLMACRPGETQPLKLFVDPGDLEVFDVDRRRFVPFLRSAAWLQAHLQSPDGIWTDLQALLRLYYGVRAERDTEFVRASRMRGEPEGPPPSQIPEQILHQLETKAAGIADRLGISPENRRRVLRLLLEWQLADPTEERSCAKT